MFPFSGNDKANYLIVMMLFLIKLNINQQHPMYDATEI